MNIEPVLALKNLELMLRRAVNSLRESSDRSELHQMLFAAFSEILTTDVLHDNVTQVINNLVYGLQANNERVQQSTLNLINMLLKSEYSVQDISELLQGQ